MKKGIGTIYKSKISMYINPQLTANDGRRKPKKGAMDWKGGGAGNSGWAKGPRGSRNKAMNLHEQREPGGT